MFVKFVARWFAIVALLAALLSLVFLTGCADDILGLGEVARQKTYQDQIQASAVIGSANALRDAELGKAQAQVDKARVEAEAQLERERLRQESMQLNARLLQAQEDAASRRFQERLIMLGMLTTSNPLIIGIVVIGGVLVGVFIAARLNGYSIGIVRRE